MRPERQFKVQQFVAAILLLLLLTSPALADRWSFAVIADNRSGFAPYRNVLRQIHSMSVNPTPKFTPIELVLACGDLDPLAKNHQIYKEVFADSPPVYLPVRGNHDQPDDVAFMLQSILPELGDRVHFRDQQNVNYFFDWKRCRFIVLDEYAGETDPLLDPEALKWLEQAIVSATHIDHVFVAFHEPNVAKSGQDQAFWDLLFEHQDKVRTVFVGHTHNYERRLIGKGDALITMINAGNAGKNEHSDHRQTIVEVMVDGPRVFYRIVQTPDKKASFSVTEQWQISAPSKQPEAGQDALSPSGADAGVH
jgi:predicted phosphodiesterase